MPKASRPCPTPGCPNLTPCAQHPPRKAWAGSTRRATLPPDWHHRTAAVHQRSGGRCEHVGTEGRCTNPANGGVDHAVHRLDHRIEHLRDLCADHHGTKTQAEAARGRRTAKG